MPFGGILTGSLIGAGGSLLGGLFGGGANKKLANTESDALKQQQQQQQAEFAQMQQLFSQLAPFFQKYMAQGSPFLNQQQTASAQQTAQQFGSEAGQFRNEMQQSGLGFGPSGATAAGLGGMASNAASTGASNYLQNLLNNENLKFQAAQGLGNLTSLMKPGAVNTPNFGPPSGLPGAIQNAGNQLSNIPFGSNSPNSPGLPTLPLGNPATVSGAMGIGLPPPTGTPTTVGWNGGSS